MFMFTLLLSWHIKSCFRSKQLRQISSHVTLYPNVHLHTTQHKRYFIKMVSSRKTVAYLFHTKTTLILDKALYGSTMNHKPRNMDVE